jgi:predicted RNA-binding Zn-ribbon protein involved in translation (DUF1610 family)
VSTRYVCDLCGFPDVAWAWTTPNQVTREQAEAGEGWYFEDEVWLICEDCHRLVLERSPTCRPYWKEPLTTQTSKQR